MKCPMPHALGAMAVVAATSLIPAHGAAPETTGAAIARPSIHDHARRDVPPSVLPTDAGENGLFNLCWDNGEPDGLSAQMAQSSELGVFLAADDFFVKAGFYKHVDTIRVCMLISESIDGQMVKPDLALGVYEDCDGRPGAGVLGVSDPELIEATLDGPSSVTGFNKWIVDFKINRLFTGYGRWWIAPYGVGHTQDGQYFWCSANNGTIQGAQGQLFNNSVPWFDVAECGCGPCTDFCFQIYGDLCCLNTDNSPFDPSSASRSLQLFGATIDTARAADNFQIPWSPTPYVELCRVEAWFATNCPTEKVFLEIYENLCDCPGEKLCTIDLTADNDGDGTADYPIPEDTGMDYNGCDIYRLIWPVIHNVQLETGKDYWLSVVARGTGNVFDKGEWMHRVNLTCEHLNITEGKIRDPMVEGLEDWTSVSQTNPRTIEHDDFAFRLYTRTPPCEALLGACCFLDSLVSGVLPTICEDLTESECFARDGVFSPGEQCGDFTCPPIGACCFGDLEVTHCEITDPDGCVGLGGTFHPGAFCSSELCFVPIADTDGQDNGGASAVQQRKSLSGAIAR